MPGLMREYGIRPWELDLFTDAELSQMALDALYRDQMENPDSVTNKAHEKREKAAQRRLDGIIASQGQQKRPV